MEDHIQGFRGGGGDGGGVHTKNIKVTNFQSFLVLKTILENYELN